MENKQLKINEIHNLYYELKVLYTQKHKGYNTSLDELVNSYHVFKEDHFINKNEWVAKYLSDTTINRFEQFKSKWLNYLIEKPYGENGIFVSIDSDWHKIEKQYLIPLLDSFEENLNKAGYEFLSYQNEDICPAPTYREIIKQGSFLYELLTKNKIVDKSYLYDSHKKTEPNDL